MRLAGVPEVEQYPNFDRQAAYEEFVDNYADKPLVVVDDLPGVEAATMTEPAED